MFDIKNYEGKTKTVMEKKKYYNANLERILKKYITAEKYGDFAPLLEEVFQRRAYEFGFSERTIEAEVQNFIANVRQIRFVSQDEMLDCETLAEFDWMNNNEIRLNLDILQRRLSQGGNIIDFAEEFFSTFTHEVYHAINYNRDKSELGLTDKIGNAAILNEIVIETAADRTTYSRTYADSDRYRVETTGYSDITFIVNLLAAAIGVTEKELLINGIQIDAHHKFTQLIDERLPSQKGYKGNIMPEMFYDTLREKLLLIYRKIGYDRSFGVDLDMKSLLGEFYKLVYEAASYQIATDNRPFSREYVAEIEYRIKKMDRISHDALENFSQRRSVITPEEVEEIKISLMPVRQKLLAQYDGIRIIQQHGTQIHERDYMTLSRAARRGDIFDYKRKLKKIGVSNTPTTFKEFAGITQDLTYTQYVFAEDFDLGRMWDNTQIIKPIVYIIKNELVARKMSINSLINAMKSSNFTRINGSTAPLQTTDDEKKQIYMQPNNIATISSKEENGSLTFATALKHTLSRVQATLEFTTRQMIERWRNGQKRKMLSSSQEVKKIPDVLTSRYYQPPLTRREEERKKDTEGIITKVDPEGEQVK